MNVHQRIEEHKHNLVARLKRTEFLRRCRSEEITRDELKTFLVQQGLYSAYFTRYLCALMSNLPQNQQVLALADNLCEELGLNGDAQTPHSVLYKNMLGNQGLDLASAEMLPSTSRLINTMFDHCRDRRYARGLGALCLGAEAIVPCMYADLISGFKACGFGAKDIEFFQIHVECDDAHAETLHKIMLDTARNDPHALGLMFGAGDALVDARIEFFARISASSRQLPVSAMDAA